MSIRSFFLFWPMNYNQQNEIQILKAQSACLKRSLREGGKEHFIYFIRNLDLASVLKGS